MNVEMSKPNFKFGGCTFRLDAYIKVVFLRADLGYKNIDTQLINSVTGILLGCDDESITIYVPTTTLNGRRKTTMPVSVPIKDIMEVYTLHVPYAKSAFVSWVRKKVANHYNKKMLKHTRKTLYKLHKY